MPESTLWPELVALYVPGDRPDRFGTALASAADVVILDLEDSVALSGKDVARQQVVNWLATAPPDRVSVRVNPVDTIEGLRDLAALSRTTILHSVRAPKVESTDQLRRIADSWEVGAPPIHALIETALGVERAFEIAAHPAVAAIGLGEADLRSDLGVASSEELRWCRERLVVAARAAGLPAPLMSAWTDLSDEAGLRASCAAGRAAGFLGRTAIHPRQLEPIIASFRPADDEVAAARAVLDGLQTAQDADRSVAVTASGHMVDPAMLTAAERTVALARAIDARLDSTPTVSRSSS